MLPAQMKQLPDISTGKEQALAKGSEERELPGCLSHPPAQPFFLVPCRVGKGEQVDKLLSEPIRRVIDTNFI